MYNVIVFAGDGSGPEVRNSVKRTSRNAISNLMVFTRQIIRETIRVRHLSSAIGNSCYSQFLQVLKVIEKYRPHLQFNFIHRLLGGVRSFALSRKGSGLTEYI